MKIKTAAALGLIFGFFLIGSAAAKGDKEIHYEFYYTDGHTDIGVSTANEVTGGHVLELHVSCSDSFPGGFSEGKSDLGGHQIARYSIEKFKDGVFDKGCSEVFVLPTLTPQPTLTPRPTDTQMPTFTASVQPPSETPDPTETPIPPTDTPRPDPTDTSRPDPSDTPKPKPTNTSKPPPTPTDQEPKASATLPPVTLTATPQFTTTETPSETPYVCVVCCVCGSQTPIVVEVIAEAPEIGQELKPIFYVLVGIFAMLGGSLILGVYNSLSKK